MKGKNFREVQEEYKEVVVGLCCICQKPVSGFYGRYGDGGVCSKKCMHEQDKKPKFLGHSEEDFFNRLGANRETS